MKEKISAFEEFAGKNGQYYKNVFQQIQANKLKPKDKMINTTVTNKKEYNKNWILEINKSWLTNFIK